MLTGHKPVGTSRYASPESIAARMCETMSTSIKQRQSAGEAVSSRENTRLRRLSTTVSETAFDPAKADVWSTGITLFSTVTGVFPWGLASPDNAVFSRWQAMYVFPASPSEDSLRAMWSAVFLTYGSCTQKKTPLSYNFMHLLRGMLHPDPVQRMSMTEVRAHPFFHRSNDCTTSKPPLMSSIPSSQTHASSASLTSTATRSGIALATATH